MGGPPTLKGPSVPTPAQALTLRMCRVDLPRPPPSGPQGLVLDPLTQKRQCHNYEIHSLVGEGSEGKGWAIGWGVGPRAGGVGTLDQRSQWGCVLTGRPPGPSWGSFVFVCLVTCPLHLVGAVPKPRQESAFPLGTV